MDDISSVLGHDITAALQDSIITDDTMTISSETLMASSSTPRPNNNNRHVFKCSTMELVKMKDTNLMNPSFDPNDNPHQCGFENIVFEIDNRCDDQKIREPSIRYCSLAQFVDGSDITRQSFRVIKLKFIQFLNII